MNRVRKLSTEILEKYEDSFGENFEDNKRALMEISIITSKELKNKIAGFITKTKKRATRERLKKEADQRAREEAAAAEEAEALEQAKEAREAEEAKPESAEETTGLEQAKEARDGGTADIKATHTWSGPAWKAKEAPAETAKTRLIEEVAAVKSQPAESTKPESAEETTGLEQAKEAQDAEAGVKAEESGTSAGADSESAPDDSES